MRSAVQRERIVRVGAWLILAFALMPNISYMGHWPEMAGTADDHHDEIAGAVPGDPGAMSADMEAHAAHCHLGPANCGGGESMIGTPFVGESSEGVALPGYEHSVDSGRYLAALDGHAPPLLQPPRDA